MTSMGRAAAAGSALMVLAAAGGARADAARGAQAYAAQCGLCHGESGAGGQGPSLIGVTGRKAASTDFAYSTGLKTTGWTWDAAHLDHYIADSQGAVPGTTMAVAVAAPAERADIIAYLGTLGSVKAVAAATSPGRSVFGDWRKDAPGTVHRITAADLPQPYATHASANFSHRAPRPGDARPQAPAGFTVSLFADGLDDPRAMRTAPNGDVFVSESAKGRVRVLRAPAGAEHAQTAAVFAEGLTGPFGLAFHPAGPKPKWLYVAERNRVVRFPYRDGQLKADGPPEVVVAELAPTQGGHVTRDIAFSLDGRRMFVSVGSGSNVAEGMTKRPVAESQADDARRGLGVTWGSEERRADVLVFTPEGKDGRIYASGIRNCVGLAVQPGRGDVWCSVNERDNLGDDLVPDYVTRVKEGAFYGWPWWYLGDHEDPRLKGERPDLKGRVTTPDVLLQPHSASLQLAFHDGRGLPRGYGASLFAAEHGSWNRAERTGYKVVRVRLRPDGTPTGDYEDFLTGFVLPDDRVWGRPVGVAVAQDGALLVSDDGSGAVWRVAPAAPAKRMAAR